MLKSDEELLSELDDLRAEVERLRAALRPFKAMTLPDHVPEIASVIFTDANGGRVYTGLCAGNLRTARAALTGGKE